MKLYEFEAADVLRAQGIPFPEYTVAATPAEARRAATKIGLPVVIKAQVLAGGRGLAGGVQTAETLDEVEKTAGRMLGSRVKGLPVECLVVAGRVAVAKEIYLGITVDGYLGMPVAILSTAGGVSIEEIAAKSPELITSRPVSIAAGLTLPEAEQIVREAALTGNEARAIAGNLYSLYRAFRQNDALLAEINPLARTPQGDYIALDARVELDDSALYRHPEFQNKYQERISNLLEKKGRDIGVTYVDLEGEISIIASGAGLGMATMDIISQKLRPANFLETGGAISAELLYQVMGLVMQKQNLKGLFINLYGGINPIHEGAKGIVRYLEEHPTPIPIVARALGNRQEETWEILKSGGITVVPKVATEKAVAELVRLLEASA